MNDKKKLILSAIFLVIGVTAISQYYNYSGVKMSASWSTYYESLTDLNNASDIIVKGTVQSTRTLDYDEDTIIKSEHEILVIDILAGKYSEKTIKIIQTGGITEEGDLIQMDGYPLLEKDQKVIVFLYEGKDGNYFFTGGPQGMYHILDDNVYPFGEPAGNTFNAEQKTNGIPIETFEKEIQPLLKNK